MSSPIISVIVPVYNTAQYVEQCCASILAQSYQNFELIVVDDGSTDGSSDVCDMIARSDKRVVCIHKENGGVSSARNKGLDVARGEYVVFVDSDDYVGNEYLEHLITHASDSPNELVLTDFQEFSLSGLHDKEYPQQMIINLRSKDYEKKQNEEYKALVLECKIFGPCYKLYRRKTIESNKLRYDTRLKIAEDFDFNYRYIQYVDRIIYFPYADYYYRVNYKPLKNDFIKKSDIWSMHIVARGIIQIAKSMCVDIQPVYNWIANKHYWFRIPSIFYDDNINYKQRRKMYCELKSDMIYRYAYKHGRCILPYPYKIPANIDLFFIWWLFFKLHAIKNVVVNKIH